MKQAPFLPLKRLQQGLDTAVVRQSGTVTKTHGTKLNGAWMHADMRNGSCGLRPEHRLVGRRLELTHARDFAVT